MSGRIRPDVSNPANIRSTILNRSVARTSIHIVTSPIPLLSIRDVGFSCLGERSYVMRMETRGPERGICNICGEMGKLTEDHIPPKGVPRVGQVYLSNLVESLGAEKAGKGSRLFQNGVKYRSICRVCNGDLLGAAYDPHLISFCRAVETTFRERLYLPQDFEVKQNRLFRSVIGHLLAHGVGLHRTGPFPSSKTDYFLDPKMSFPSDLRLYCWVYPYQRQVISRWMASIFDTRYSGESFIFSIAKFFPVAWLCSSAELPPYIQPGVVRVDSLATGDLDDTAVITLSPSNVPRPTWPEAPGDNGAVFLNRRGTVATPRRGNW